MPIPTIKTCAECGRKFNSFSIEHDTCLSCVSKPHRQYPPVDVDKLDEAYVQKKMVVEKEEVIVKPEILLKPLVMADRECIDCRIPYAPTSPCQKRCIPCGAARKKFLKKKWKVKMIKGEPEPEPVPVEPAVNQAEQILGLLVYLKIVTKDQIESCKKFIGIMDKG
jgi:hypothetical protein